MKTKQQYFLKTPEAKNWVEVTEEKYRHAEKMAETIYPDRFESEFYFGKIGIPKDTEIIETSDFYFAAFIMQQTELIPNIKFIQFNSIYDRKNFKFDLSKMYTVISKEQLEDDFLRNNVPVPIGDYLAKTLYLRQLMKSAKTITDENFFDNQIER